MSTENSEPDLNIPLTSEPEKQSPENSNFDIMCAKFGQQQDKNLNLFTQNLANHLSIFLNRLEETNKDKSITVADAKTSNYSCSMVIANNEDIQGSLSKAIPNNANGDENNDKKANKQSLAVKDGENPRSKRKRPLSSLEGNKKHYSDTNSSCKYKPNSGLEEMLQIPTR